MNMTQAAPVSSSALLRISSRPIVLFAGAGLSVDPPTNAPVWKDVQRSLIEAVTSRLRLEDWPARDELVARSEVLTEGLRPETFFQALNDRCVYFDSYALLKLVIGAQPNRHHLAVAELLRSGRLAAVITTNFDENIEHGIQAVMGRPARRCVSIGDYTDANATRPAEVYKLHGTISDPASMSATLSQTAILPKEKATLLRSLLTEKAVLFVGYSGNDDDVWPVISESLAETKQPVVVCVHPGSDPAEPVRSLRASGLQIIETTLDPVWGALGHLLSPDDTQRETTRQKTARQKALAQSIQDMVGSLPLWQLASLLGHVALSGGDCDSAMFFGELAADIVDTREYGYGPLERARGKLAAQHLELLAQTALGYAMLPGQAYWTGSYDDERLQFDMAALERLLTIDELCTALLLWAWSDCYNDSERAAGYVDRVRNYGSNTPDICLSLARVSAQLAYQRGDLKAAAIAFEDALGKCAETNDPLTYARISCDAALVAIEAGQWSQAQSVLSSAIGLARRSRDDFLLTRLYSALLVVGKATHSDTDVVELSTERDRHLSVLKAKGALQILVSRGMDPEDVRFICPLCWHDNLREGPERICARCGARLDDSETENPEFNTALQQLQAIVAENQDAILRLTRSERHQYFVEPDEAIRCVTSSETEQIITGIVGLLGEIRHTQSHQLRQGSLAELLPCLYGATVELCESKHKRDEAFKTLGFYEHCDLLYHVAVSSTDRETRETAVDWLASLRVTDSYQYAQKALRTLVSNCPYVDTRRQAHTEYKRGVKDYGTGDY